MKRITRTLRAAAFGFCFAVFGLCGVMIRLLVFPCILLIPARYGREKIAKTFISCSMVFFVWLMKATGAVSVSIHGAEKLQRSGLFILANHPSLIDVVILLSATRHPDCVIKASLLSNPFTAGPICTAGYISNESGPALVKESIDSIARGNNLILFPEGTRTKPSGKMLFQRGAANIAVRGNLAITPVIVTVSEVTLTKESKWYKPPPTKPHFNLYVLDDIEIASLVADKGEPAMQARWLTKWLEQFFSLEIAKYEQLSR